MKRQTIFAGVLLLFFVTATLFGKNGTQQGDRSDTEQRKPPEDSGSRELFKALDLDTICPNPDLPPPGLIDDLPPYQSEFMSAIRWKPILDDPAVRRYLVVASVDCTFTDPINYYCEPDSNLDSICVIEVPEEDTIWYRAYSKDNEGCISPPSTTIATIQDMSGPIITRFVLQDETGDTVGAHERTVNVLFEGTDLCGCASIDVSEDTTRPEIFQSYPIDDPMACCGSGDETFKLSAEQEKKIVYARMTDILGNRGDWESYAIFYARKLYNYPNPFIPAKHTVTNIVYWLSKQCDVVYIEIYDSFGNHVRRISGGGKEGFNTVTWDGCNANGELVGNGGYLCVLKGDKKYTHKIAVLK